MNETKAQRNQRERTEERTSERKKEGFLNQSQGEINSKCLKNICLYQENRYAEGEI